MFRVEVEGSNGQAIIYCESASFKNAVTIAQALHRVLMGCPLVTVLYGDEIKYDTRNGHNKG